MSIFNIATKFVGGHLKNIEWWPALFKPQDGDNTLTTEIHPWPLMPFEFYLAKFLKEHSQIDEAMWRQYGVKLINNYVYDYTDNRVWILGMVYLLASDPDILNKIKIWMKDNGFDFGTFDPDS